MATWSRLLRRARAAERVAGRAFRPEVRDLYLTQAQRLQRRGELQRAVSRYADEPPVRGEPLAPRQMEGVSQGR